MDVRCLKATAFRCRSWHRFFEEEYLCEGPRFITGAQADAACSQPGLARLCRRWPPATTQIEILGTDAVIDLLQMGMANVPISALEQVSLRSKSRFMM